MLTRVLRRSRVLSGDVTPWQEPYLQFTGVSWKPFPNPDHVKPPPSWVRVHTGPESLALLKKVPSHQWVTAYEYEQAKGQIPALERLGLTESMWAFHKDLHYKLVDNADKYLVGNDSLDDFMAAEVWNRWCTEAQEHLAYHGIMTWRYHSFTGSNLEVLPPGKLREEVRYTALVDLHPDDQERVWQIRNQWLPERFRCNYVADPMRVSRLHVSSRNALLSTIDEFQAAWTAKSTSDGEKSMVDSYCNLWRDAVHPTRSITPAVIGAERNLDLLQEWFEEIFADTGDNRLYLIAERAATLREDKSAVGVAKWCHGMMARDADTSARAVVAFPAPEKESAAEAQAAKVPGDFSGIQTKEQLAAYLAHWGAHFERTSSIYVPADRKMYAGAWADFCGAANGIGPHGSKLRYAWWSALNKNSTTNAHYGPPLLPVRKDADGSRFMLRMLGALESQGAFGSLDQDADYVADAISFIDLDGLSDGDLAGIAQEYPTFGVNFDKLSPEAAARVSRLKKFVKAQ